MPTNPHNPACRGGSGHQGLLLSYALVPPTTPHLFRTTDPARFTHNSILEAILKWKPRWDSPEERECILDTIDHLIQFRWMKLERA